MARTANWICDGLVAAGSWAAQDGRICADMKTLAFACGRARGSSAAAPAQSDGEAMGGR
jgi:hypothetical protein